MTETTTPAAPSGTVGADVVPLWPSRGFWGFCRYEIRKGLMIRYWIKLPAMWREEQAFRREFTEALNKYATGHNPDLSGAASASAPCCVGQKGGVWARRKGTTL
jgi:hypothetical protein